MASSPEWVFDYASPLIIEDDFSLLPVNSIQPPEFNWSPPPHHHHHHPHLSVEVDDLLKLPDETKDNSSRKRVRPATAPSGSKACKEKIRRDKLNDRFVELGCILEPGRSLKADKALLLNDAIRLVTHLREETKKLKETTENLQYKLTELKAEKKELGDEKQMLKLEKEKLEMQVKVFTIPPNFLPHPASFPTPFATQTQFSVGKFGPYITYPGTPMWQFMTHATVDTSQDHVLRPPVA